MAKKASSYTLEKREYNYNLSMRVLKEENIPFKRVSEKAIIVDDMFYFIPTTGYFRYADGRPSYFKGPDRGIYNLLRRRARDKKLKP